MSERRCAILYLSGTLPSRSETFVYREIFALRDRGFDVRIASVHAPERELGDARVNALADEVVPVYGTGPGRLILDALLELLRHPLSAIPAWARGKLDALFGRDLTFSRRPRVLWQALAGLALARRVRRHNIVHVHAHMAHVPTTIAMNCAAALGVPFSFTGHAIDIFKHRTLLAPKLRRATFVSCISHWHRTFYREYVDLPDERLPIVRCGVDISAFTPPGTPHASGIVNILSVGRLVEKKGFDVLITALAELGDHAAGVQCSIVGAGPQRGVLDELITTHNLADRVHLLGERDNDEVRALMAEADLFILPCRITESGDRDGIPVVLMEAMASGLCAVSGDLPAIRELVDHDKTGIMIAPGSGEELVAALRGLLHDPGRRQQLAQAGRRRVVEEFSTDVNAERLITVLKRSLGSSA